MKTSVHYIVKIFFILFTAGIIPPCSSAQSVKAIEYFFDVDPGTGNGRRINLNPAAEIDTVLNFDMSSVSFGLHRLFVRALDTNANWGHYHIYPVIKGTGNVPVVLQKMEYYFDSDPGFGSGLTINLQSVFSADTTVIIDLAAITEGIHQVFFRVMDNTGKWSLSQTYPVIKGPGYNQPLTVNKLEYFIDSDPGVGKAIPVNPGRHFILDSTFLLAMPKTTKDSINVFVRAIDNRGLWGLYHDTMIAVTCNLYPPQKSYMEYTPVACGNTVISFRDTIIADQWKWNFGNGDSASGQNFVYSYKQPGTYNVSHYIISEKGCISDTVSKIIIVQPPLTVYAGPDREIYPGDIITLNPEITGNDSSYLWTPNLYMNNNTIRNPTITGVNDIKYSIQVTGRGNCTASDSILIKVDKTPRLVNVPNAFSPNGDGINDTWVIKNLLTYTDSHVQVFNRYGQLIFESNGYQRPWDGRYHDKPLPFGTYYYTITLRKGQKPLTGSVSILY